MKVALGLLAWMGAGLWSGPSWSAPPHVSSTGEACEAQMISPEERLSIILETYRGLLGGVAASSLSRDELMALSRATRWDEFFTFRSDGTQERSIWIETMGIVEEGVLDSIDLGMSESALLEGLRLAVTTHMGLAVQEVAATRELEEQVEAIDSNFRHMTSVASRRLLAVPGHDWVITGGFHSILQVWDYVRGVKVFDLPGINNTSGDVFALAVTPDGRIALAGGSDKKVRCWDLVTGALKWTGPVMKHEIGNLVFSPDSLSVFSGGIKGQIIEFNLANGNSLGEWQTVHDESDSVFWIPSANSRALAVVRSGYPTSEVFLQSVVRPSESQAVRVVQALSGWLRNSVLSVASRDHAQSFTGQIQKAWLVKPEQSGTAARIAVVTQDGSLILHDATLSNSMLVLSQALASFSPGSPTVPRPLADGRSFIAFSQDGRLALWSAIDGSMISNLQALFPENLGKVRGMALSSDSTHLAVGYENDLMVVDLSDPASPWLAERLGRSPPRGASGVLLLNIQFSSDGAYLMVSPNLRHELLSWRWVDHDL